MKRFDCAVCHNESSREEMADKVFSIDGEYVLIRGIPAVVCTRCGEQSFSSESAEKVRLMVQQEAKSTKRIPMKVYDFAA